MGVDEVFVKEEERGGKEKRSPLGLLFTLEHGMEIQVRGPHHT